MKKVKCLVSYYDMISEGQELDVLDESRYHWYISLDFMHTTMWVSKDNFKLI